MVDAVVCRPLSRGTGVSRRDVIRNGGLAVAGGALVTSGLDALLSTTASTGTTAATMPVTTTVALLRSTFAAALGETFRVALSPAGSIALRLAGVHDLSRAQEDGPLSEAEREQRFLIQFSGPADRPLPQETYRFEHARIGTFALFIVPMAGDGGHQTYEAIFNRSPA